MYNVILAVILIMLSIATVMYYAIRGKRNINYKGKFLDLKETVKIILSQ